MPVGGDSLHQAGSTRCRRGASASAPPITMPPSSMAMGAGRQQPPSRRPKARTHRRQQHRRPSASGPGAAWAARPAGSRERRSTSDLHLRVARRVWRLAPGQNPPFLPPPLRLTGFAGPTALTAVRGRRAVRARWPAPLDRSRRNPLTAALASGTLLASAGLSREEREPARRESGSESRLRGSERGSLDSSCPTPQHVTASSILASRATSRVVRGR